MMTVTAMAMAIAAAPRQDRCPHGKGASPYTIRLRLISAQY
jgi:hypothetical protein